ncbi:MAG: hypothetical protein K5650_03700 [Bacteroidales bacterium]|nr:hypothetical protein [Bacteroidales bacterium]
MKRTTHILLIVLGAVALAVLVIVANVARSRSQVAGLKIKINYDGQSHLVDERVVTDSLHRAIPHLMQQQVRVVDLAAVREAASRVPYLENCDASVSVGGNVVVKADQRRPIVRLFMGDRELYLDSRGRAMPPSKIGDCACIVANGNFIENIDTLLFNRLDLAQLAADSITSTYGIVQVWQLSVYLDKHPEYGCLFDQIFLDTNGDLILVPKIGDHTVVVGKNDNLDNKFARLQTFYTSVMPKCGWDTYSLLNLKFDNQVVCTKR